VDSASNIDAGAALEDLGGELAGETGTPSSSPFFVSKKAAAVLKHAILRQYVVPWAVKVGTSGRRVAFIDGFAGPGRYADGTEGSPSLIIASATGLPGGRDLECHFVEWKKADFKRLSEVVRQGQRRGVHCYAYQGRLEQHLNQLLAEVDGIPAFFFLDPFGLGLNFNAMNGILSVARPYPGMSTELMVNFSANAVRRIGGLLSAPETPGRRATLAGLDQVCGGQWWRDVFREHADNSERVQVIAEGWARRLAIHTSADYWCVPVRNRAELQPVYHLVFFTRHPDGMWLFADSLAKAQREWRRHLAPPPVEVDDALFQLDDPFVKEEEHRQNQWKEAIKANVLRTLAAEGPYRFSTHIRSVLTPEVAGLADEPLIRKAVKELYAEGRTGCDGKGRVKGTTSSDQQLPSRHRPSRHLVPLLAIQASSARFRRSASPLLEEEGNVRGTASVS
jgi:three-Cys-motif partner protein